jgi:hypothetical protein
MFQSYKFINTFVKTFIMKRIIFLLILSLLLLSNACEKDWKNEKTVETEFKEKLRGSYNVKLIIEKDTTLKDSWERTGDNLIVGLASLMQVNYTFKDDGMLIIEAFGEKSQGKWSMKGNKLSIAGEKENKMQEFNLKVFDGNFNNFVMEFGDSTSNFKGFIFTKIGVEEKEKK